MECHLYLHQESLDLHRLHRHSDNRKWDTLLGLRLEHRLGSNPNWFQDIISPRHLFHRNLHNSLPCKPRLDLSQPLSHRFRGERKARIPLFAQVLKHFLLPPRTTSGIPQNGGNRSRSSNSHNNNNSDLRNTVNRHCLNRNRHSDLQLWPLQPKHLAQDIVERQVKWNHRRNRKKRDSGNDEEAAVTSNEGTTDPMIDILRHVKHVKRV